MALYTLAAQERAIGLTEVNTALDQMDQVTQQADARRRARIFSRAPGAQDE